MAIEHSKREQESGATARPPESGDIEPVGALRSAGRLRTVGFIALAAAGVTAVQAVYTGFTGEELCVGEGCALVGGLSRISPPLFNLFGTAVFSAIATLAFLARRPALRSLETLLHALLTAALAAEGVLFAYQWHVAGAWCVYCLGILAAVAALNLAFGVRRSLLGFSSFAASAVIFSLLSFVPFNKTLADGTAAVHGGAGSPELLLLFSENCPHCKRVVAALTTQDRCAVRFNPVSQMPRETLPAGEKSASYDSRVNLAAARILGIQTVPILVAREAGGMRILTGEEAILSYVNDACTERQPVPSLFDPTRDPLLSPGDDGCGLKTDCD